MAPRTGLGGDKGFGKGSSLGFIYGEWNVSNNPGFFKGQFNNFQREMVAINRARSQEFQENVVALMESRIKRKPSSTGRLVQVTADKRNSSFTNARGGFTPSTLGWFVGNTKFLDSSQAKYWRTIEEGSAVTWKKRSFTGAWLDNSGNPLYGWWGASAFLAGNRVLAAPPFTPPGGGSTGKFRPWYRPKGWSRANAARKWQLVIKNPIQPMDAYYDAWYTSGFGARAMSDWTKAWQESFGRIPTKQDRALNAPARGFRKR